MRKALSGLAVLMLAILPSLAWAEDKTESAAAKSELKTAVFAGGCFWSMQHAFEGIAGVHNISAGYAGGSTPRPTYVEVSKGKTGYVEAVQISYDPAKINYERLANIYWRNTDPFDDKGQFCDKGDNYRPVVFVRGDDQKEIAEKLKSSFEKRFGKPLVTEIRAASTFYPAEEYHQNYASEHAFIYGMYRDSCGQDRTLRQIWGEEAGGGAFRKAE